MQRCKIEFTAGLQRSNQNVSWVHQEKGIDLDVLLDVLLKNADVHADVPQWYISIFRRTSGSTPGSTSCSNFHARVGVPRGVHHDL